MMAGWTYITRYVVLVRVVPQFDRRSPRNNKPLQNPLWTVSRTIGIEAVWKHRLSSKPKRETVGGRTFEYIVAPIRTAVRDEHGSAALMAALKDVEV